MRLYKFDAFVMVAAQREREAKRKGEWVDGTLC
jgi:hypothetical protein